MFVDECTFLHALPSFAPTSPTCSWDRRKQNCRHEHLRWPYFFCQASTGTRGSPTRFPLSACAKEASAGDLAKSSPPASSARPDRAEAERETAKGESGSLRRNPGFRERKKLSPWSFEAEMPWFSVRSCLSSLRNSGGERLGLRPIPRCQLLHDLSPHKVGVLEAVIGKC